MFCEVTVTSDLWTPNSNRFILESELTCVWWRQLMWLFWKLHYFGALSTLDIGALQRVSHLFSNFPYIQLSTCSFWLGQACTLLFLHKLTCVPNMNKLPQTFLRYHHHENGKDRGTKCMFWWMDRRSENITSAAQSHKNVNRSFKATKLLFIALRLLNRRAWNRSVRQPEAEETRFMYL